MMIPSLPADGAITQQLVAYAGAAKEETIMVAPLPWDLFTHAQFCPLRRALLRHFDTSGYLWPARGRTIEAREHPPIPLTSVACDLSR